MQDGFLMCLSENLFEIFILGIAVVGSILLIYKIFTLFKESVDS